jgi:hypothetical protein
MKNLNPWIIPLAIVFFSIQAVFAMYFEISRLRFQLDLTERSKSIANDQIDELMYIVSNLRAEKESTATQSFVAGVVEAVKDKNHYDAIWHDGYNRGGAVAQYASEIVPVKNTEAKAVETTKNQTKKVQSAGLLP